jgi:hypothetical protein
MNYEKAILELNQQFLAMMETMDASLIKTEAKMLTKRLTKHLDDENDQRGCP